MSRPPATIYFLAHLHLRNPCQSMYILAIYTCTWGPELDSRTRGLEAIRGQRNTAWHKLDPHTGSSSSSLVRQHKHTHTPARAHTYTTYTDVD